MKALALCGTLTACLIALASPVAMPAAPRAEPANPDADRLQGLWRRVSADGTGSVAPMTLQIDGTALIVRRSGEQPEEADFSLDAAAVPKAINARFENGWAFGIYQLDGDTLRLCISEPGPTAVRPTKFQAFGRSVTLAEFRRVTN